MLTPFLHSIDYDALGSRIRAHRKQAGLTQAALGKAVGLSTSYIGHIERGMRIASINTLLRIANTLNVSVDALLRGFPSQAACIYTMPAYIHMLNNIMRVLMEHKGDWFFTDSEYHDDDV